jgi:hypothetical protein
MKRHHDRTRRKRKERKSKGKGKGKEMQKEMQKEPAGDFQSTYPAERHFAPQEHR